MTKRALTTLLLAMLLSASLVVTAAAVSGHSSDIRDGMRTDRINSFNVGPYPMEYRQATSELANEFGAVRAGTPPRHSVGSATAPDAGIGVGESIDVTWDDVFWTWGQGRQVAHYWNGQYGENAKVSVHFAYRDSPDTVTGMPFTNTGYNVYDATGGGNWPNLADGCDLQSTDTIGGGSRVSLDMMDNGRVVIGALATHDRRFDNGDEIFDNLIYYQDASVEFDCNYAPTEALFANVTWVDSLLYEPMWLESVENYSRDPQVVTQWNGTNTIVHLALGENFTNGVPLPGTDYSSGSTYGPWVYFRKVGNTYDAGSWEEAQVLDSLNFVWTSLAAAPYPHEDVAFVYVNESYYGALMNNSNDIDVWCRESNNYGVTWQDAYSITNYTNGIGGDPNHFTGWVESGCMFDQGGDLHAWWTAKPTSADPHFDGFNWQDFDENLYHWAKSTDEIVKVANGNFMNDDMLTGSMNTLHCGFGGSNAGYLGFAAMGQCNDKLYLLWSQIHERANRFDWRSAATQPAPGILDDCSYTGARLAMANWEILMSVAKVSSSSLWDAPRSVSNTYAPDCGLEGDPDATGRCGSEWKPSIEKYALNETGFTDELTWPTGAVVDLTPEPGSYGGTWYLNMEYVDDQFPGPWNWGRSNPPGTENSMKWVRLACVEPIEAPQIDVVPEDIAFPTWVPTGVTTPLTVTVVNEGNVVLKVEDITCTEDGGGPSGWLSASESPSVGDEFEVPAGVDNTRTFDLLINAGGISVPTWLDGDVVLTSDADNFPVLTVDIHILAAAHVEPVVWDTVQTHVYMYDPLYPGYTEGECVGLTVGNQGDLGWGAGSSGRINLDYYESGKDCDTTRARNQYYLISASAFTIMADDNDGANARLTQVTNDANQADATGWDPVVDKGSIANGPHLSAAGTYDSTYTGRFVNSDTTIAMERIVYGPRSTDPENETINFMILHTKVYSADEQAHDHVTIGNVVDWDIPAEDLTNGPQNSSAVSGTDFIYVQGTDTTGVLSCQSHTRRLGTEAFGGGYTTAEWLVDDCVNHADDYYGFNVLFQGLMVDTTHYRDGTPLVPNQPMPDVWWAETSLPGLNAASTVQDQAVWFTYKFNHSLGAEDTLNYWTVLTTTRDGDAAQLAAQVAYARDWYLATVRGCEVGCCSGMVGDANDNDAEVPSIGDITMMIDAKFITGDCNVAICLAEADVNRSGTDVNPPLDCDDITIGDITKLIDYLFITGKDDWDEGYGLGKLPPCP